MAAWGLEQEAISYLHSVASCTYTMWLNPFLNQILNSTFLSIQILYYLDFNVA